MKTIRGYMWVPIALSLALAGVVAQSGRQQVPSRMDALADQAPGVPPEFAADILLRLAKHPDVKDKKWKICKVEEAFSLAARAQHPYKRVGGKHTDTRESRQSWDHGFDSLSLRCRAIDQMLELDTSRARALFEEIRIPELPAPQCHEALVPNIDIYYATFSHVLSQAFSAGDRVKGRDVEAIQERIQSIRSPIQIAPMVAVLLIGVRTSRQEELLSSLAASLGRLYTTDRQFAMCESQISGLLFQLQAAKLDVTPWIPAVRDLLVRQYTRPRCGDRSSSTDLPEGAREFNTFLEKFTHGLPADLSLPITSAEVRPSGISDSCRVTEFWQSADAKVIRQALTRLALRSENPRRAWSDSERTSSEWDAKRLELVKLLDGWHEGIEDATSLYHMKVDTYAVLSVLTPEGESREDAISKSLSFIEQNYGRIDDRSEWFTGFTALLDRVSISQQRSRLTEILHRSRNPVILLYAQWLDLAPHGRPL